MLGSSVDIAEARNAATMAEMGSSNSVIRCERSAHSTNRKISQPNIVDQKTSCQLVCINIAKSTT